MSEEILVQDEPFESWDRVLLNVKSKLGKFPPEEVSKIVIEKNKITVMGPGKTFR